MLSAAFGIASALGPALGGWMTEHMGWRSVFYVNLPVGLIALPIVWRFLPRMVHAERSGQAIDWRCRAASHSRPTTRDCW